MSQPRGRRVLGMATSAFLERIEAIRGFASAEERHQEQQHDARLRVALGMPRLTCHNCLMHALNLRLQLTEDYGITDEHGRALSWSINKAVAEIAAADLVPQPVTATELWALLEGHDLTLAHLDHIPSNASDIGILAPAPDTSATGYALINGSHRAARALRDGRQFYAYVLTFEMSRRTLLSAQEFNEIQAAVVAFLQNGMHPKG